MFHRLPEIDKSLLLNGDLADLLYADDTLLLSVSAASLERFLKAVSNAGASYGLELHWGKLQLMRVRSEAAVRRPDHTGIEAKPEITYLGSIVSDDGRVSRELARRLGMAHSEFRALSRIWRHSSLGRKRKIKIFEATVLPKLLYGLAAAWLNTSERRRLDGFQNRCLRDIWGIKPAFVSRVSNARVLQTTSQKPLTKALEKQQLLLYGRVFRQPTGNCMRDVTFCPGSLRPAVDRYVRKLGRPRLEWTTEVAKLALQAAGGIRFLDVAIGEANRWQRVVESFYNR